MVKTSTVAYLHKMMEAQDAERTVIAKPTASRPSFSSSNSFYALYGLCSGTASTLSPSPLSEIAIAVIKPKTVRIKSATVNRAAMANVSSKGEVSAPASWYLSENDLGPEIKSTVVYKPLAKLVSRKTAHLLANMESFHTGHPYVTAQVQSQVQQADSSDHHLQTQIASNLYSKLPSQVKSSRTSESLHGTCKNLEENQKTQLSTMSGDRPSYDGYNWRKYGQKQVKGSEFPRSSYKCTHPNCLVKKKVERSFDGQIAEIVYKGEHNHSKPHPPKCQPSGLQEQGFVSDVSGQETDNPSWSTPNMGSEVYERRIANSYETKLSVNPFCPGESTNPSDSLVVGAFNCGVVTAADSCGLSGDFEKGGTEVHAEEDEPSVKRRKNAHLSNEPREGSQDPRTMLQSSTESEVLGDGFRWRKYGQKVVKGNPYPRSYYRCTNIKCNVRKHVERAVDDPRAFITTYEGKHNHEVPTVGNLKPVASDPDSAAPSNKGKRYV